MLELQLLGNSLIVCLVSGPFRTSGARVEGGRCKAKGGRSEEDIECGVCWLVVFKSY